MCLKEDLRKRKSMQFGFRPLKGTTDATCTVRQMQENGKKHYSASVMQTLKKTLNK